MNKLLMIIAIVFVVTCASALQTRPREKQGSDDKDCSKREFDRKMSNVFGQFGPEDHAFPETSTQLKEYCRDVKEAKDLSKKYSDECLEGTSQTLLALGNYNFEKVNKQYCSKTAKKRDDFLKWSKCGNSAKPEMNSCWSKMISNLSVTKKVRNEKSRVPIICCNYYEWVKCTVSALKAKGSNTCPKSHVDGYEAHIKKSTVESMNLICSKYEGDQAKCQSLFDQLPSTRPKKLYKTPYLYIFEVFKNL